MGSEKVSIKEKQPEQKGLQYFSKWRDEWIDFEHQPTTGELYSYSKYFYQIRTKPIGN